MAKRSGKIVALRRLLFGVFILSQYSCADSSGNKGADGVVAKIVGTWRVVGEFNDSDVLDKCIFTEEYRYTCYGYPPPNGDITLIYTGRFSLKGDDLELYTNSNPALPEQENIVYRLKLINVDSHSLTLLYGAVKATYNRDQK